MSWNNVRQAFQRLMSNPNFKTFLGSPVTKIVGINTGMFLLWRIKGVSQTFLVKHFSFNHFNIKQHRYHTLLTYGFSNFGFFSFLFNMIIIGSFGRIIRINYGNRVIWALYLIGTLFGGLAMNFAMPHMPIVIPQVGPDAAVSAMLTFFGLLNLNQSVLLFFFPVKMWILLAGMGFYSLIQPSKKNFGGMLAGLLIYQLFKIKII